MTLKYDACLTRDKVPPQSGWGNRWLYKERVYLDQTLTYFWSSRIPIPSSPPTFFQELLLSKPSTSKCIILKLPLLSVIWPLLSLPLASPIPQPLQSRSLVLPLVLDYLMLLASEHPMASISLAAFPPPMASPASLRHTPLRATMLTYVPRLAWAPIFSGFMIINATAVASLTSLRLHLLRLISVILPALVMLM